MFSEDVVGLVEFLNCPRLMDAEWS